MLTYLLSLEDGTRNDVKTLADERPGPGRKAIAAALDELAALGYYVRETARHEDGRIRTTTAIYDIPQKTAKPKVVPIPGRVGTGQPDVEASGTYPSKETPEKETSPLPPVEGPAPTAVAPVEAPKGGGEGESSTKDEEAACAPLVVRIGRQDPRLTVGLPEMGKVLPLVAEWRRRGASDDQIIHAITAGLPADIKSPVGLIRDRLTRKMPVAVPAVKVTPLPVMVECPGCKAPSRVHGLCHDCREDEAAPVVEEMGNRHADELRRRMGWKAAS
ncbi:hypothetical protein [Nonomuraea sp. NPDC052265]|uniref:hypothetical protein n=1 Tax=Nonomuraea sp. NPDC052265 TaxID=3364374 RepID=UPI0037C7C113